MGGAEGGVVSHGAPWRRMRTVGVSSERGVCGSESVGGPPGVLGVREKPPSPP